jgi:nitrogen fixation NifU-like protein
MSNHETELPEGLGESFFDHLNAPRNVGTMEKPDGKARMVGICGDALEVAIQVNGNTIKDIRINPEGCAYTLVCASAMSDLVKGKTMDDALYLEPDEVADELGGLPDDHYHCARLAVNALGEAIAEAFKAKTEAEAKQEAGHAHP